MKPAIVNALVLFSLFICWLICLCANYIKQMVGTYGCQQNPWLRNEGMEVVGHHWLWPYSSTAYSTRSRSIFHQSMFTKFCIYFLRIYEVQTNSFVQTVQTSIWTTGSTSMWLGRAVKCKITQSPIPLGCWSGGPDWSLHGLHEEVGLHLIYSHNFFINI